ncbi:MAG: DUF669 domain-containing protein [Candidatus Paceibacterota bacterium]|jgi:hypothetical protein
MAELNFDSNDVDPVGSFDPIPLGEYVAVISASEMKMTKSGKGQYLQLTYDIIDGEFKGRKVFERLNLVNENEQAQEIAQRTLSAICRCVGVLHPKNSEELHDKPMVIKVGIRPASGEYQASNVVKGYSRTDGKDLKEVTEATPVAKAVATGEKKLKPWQKK